MKRTEIPVKKRILCILLAAVLCVLSGCSGDNGRGYVYYINFKPEADAAWQELAQKYTAETGVRVKVVTAASGSYDDTLSAQMNKTVCPTLFNCSNAQSVENWHDYCYDLKDSRIYELLESDDYCLYDNDGRLCSIGYCYEAFGIITNKTLLEKSGHSVEEIVNFDTLKSVAEDIHSRRGELGFDAFTSSGLDGSSSWRFSGHLANIPLFYEFREDGIVTQPSGITGKYLDKYRNVWDMYVDNGTVGGGNLVSATGNMAEEEFGNGKAVFFQNGTWEYSALTAKDKFAMDPESVTIIPIYCGAKGEENAGLCSGTEAHWSVNAFASQKDIDATIDFLCWVVTSDDGKKMMSDCFGTTPFKDHLPGTNGFLNEAERLMNEGKYTITWDFTMTPNTDTWRAGVVSALQDYSSGNADWDKVRNAFVSGWAFQYKQEHCIFD